jgi:CCR4-NOT complex subunit CAF16
MKPAVDITDLTFAYPGESRPVFRGFSLQVPLGARCLLLGGNGVGKSTLLRLIAGRHMIPNDSIRVFGRPAFHDTSLADEVAFLGGPFDFTVDITVAEVLAARLGIDPVRRARVLEILEIDPSWHMHRVSDGQRRRVQILLHLERNLSLILLDEVTADLDIVARADLLRFLREESQQRQVTVMYATHVLDGIAEWATYLAFLSPGRLHFFDRIDAALALAPTLRELCERWMREDRQVRG